MSDILVERGARVIAAAFGVPDDAAFTRLNPAVIERYRAAARNALAEFDRARRPRRVAATAINHHGRLDP